MPVEPEQAGWWTFQSGKPKWERKTKKTKPDRLVVTAVRCDSVSLTFLSRRPFLMMPLSLDPVWLDIYESWLTAVKPETGNMFSDVIAVSWNRWLFRHFPWTSLSLGIPIFGHFFLRTFFLVSFCFSDFFFRPLSVTILFSWDLLSWHLFVLTWFFILISFSWHLFLLASLSLVILVIWEHNFALQALRKVAQCTPCTAKLAQSIS